MMWKYSLSQDQSSANLLLYRVGESESVLLHASNMALDPLNRHDDMGIFGA